MRFEERELKPFAQPVSAAALKEGNAYFSVQFFDKDMLIPIVEPFVFLGKNLRADDVDRLYFQAYESYCQGVRYDSPAEDDYTAFQIATPDSIKHLFEYERALDGLMQCALRRRKSAGTRDTLS